MKFFTVFAALFLFQQDVYAQEWGLNVDAETLIVLTDTDTGITNLKTLFINEPTGVVLKGISWVPVTADGGDYDTLMWTTSVDGIAVDSGNVTLSSFEQPTEIDAGSVTVDSNGEHTIEIFVMVGNTTITASVTLVAYKPAVSLFPLLVVLLLAVTTHMVELSLFTSIFVGACIISGNLIDGFKDSLSVYLLDALSNEGHCYVVLFTLFLSGMVGLMERAGGMLGFTKFVSKYAKSPRMGQLACFTVGCLIFFDDYANCLLAGETMRPLFDTLYISREKLAFIVDATAAPIASISPISSWVGFEADLIQTELDRIIEIKGTDEIGIETSGLAVFFQTIRYRYYSIFMILFMFITIMAGRDSGPMLVSERKVRVYERTDGGDGKGKATDSEGHKANTPAEHTPQYAYNMFIPIGLLVGLIFYLLVKTGEQPGVDQTILDKIEGADSYSALLWGTFGAAVCTALFYLLQWFRDGQYALPNPSSFCNVICSKNVLQDIANEDESEPSKARPLLTVPEIVDSLLHGMARIFPALIVLILAWACGTIMVSVGTDRLFARWILGGINPELLPTLSFLISFFIGIATGTSWGTMTILMPLLLVPTYLASDGNPTIFYATTAGILAGSVAGDHVSPISDTTVLSALACDCNLLRHVVTQFPYVVFVVFVCIVVGTLPIGFEIWPNAISILFGIAFLLMYTFLFCMSPTCPSGKYDIITEIVQKIKKDPVLETLREDTVSYYSGNVIKHVDETYKKEKVDEYDEVDNDEEDISPNTTAKNDVNKNDDDDEEGGGNKDDEEKPLTATIPMEG